MVTHWKLNIEIGQCVFFSFLKIKPKVGFYFGGEFSWFFEKKIALEKEHFVKFYHFLICQKLSQYEKVLKIFPIWYFEHHHIWIIYGWSSHEQCHKTKKIMIIMKLTLSELTKINSPSIFNFIFLWNSGNEKKKKKLIFPPKVDWLMIKQNLNPSS